MSEHSDTPPGIILGGDWTNIGIIERLSEVCDHLGALLSSRRSNAEPLDSRICLSGVETIDASGCQLLAIFFRHVRQHGLRPIVINLPEDFRLSMELFGFSSELEGMME